MSVRLHCSIMVEAPLPATWRTLIDWHGQERWIPLTTMRVLGDRAEGIGTRVRALHGLALGPLPLGLIDRFVATGWSPPPGVHGTSSLEVTHLGPYFTGIGVFSLASRGAGRTWVGVTEVFDLPAAPLLETGARLLGPLFRFGLQHSLRSFARVAESSTGGDA